MARHRAHHKPKSKLFAFMTSIAATPKQFFPWLQALFAPARGAALRPLWMESPAHRHAITALAARIVTVDGNASPSEITAFGALFPSHGSDAIVARSLLHAQMQDTSPAMQYARQLRVLGNDVSQRVHLLEQFVQLAHCDAPINVSELELLRSIAQMWGVDAAAFRALISRVLKSKSSSPYEVLGVSRRASDATIRYRYLEQVRCLHPDRVISSGMSQETEAIMNERMADINAAHDAIVSMRKGGKKVAVLQSPNVKLTKGARV
jgi:DnaJ like chaperone protein